MGSIWIRFPNGKREFRISDGVLHVGARVRFEGETYRVVSVSDEHGHQVATVELESPSIGDLLTSEEGVGVLDLTEIFA